MRYYLDTNCLTGYTFFQDWWHSDANRLFDSDNDLYIGDTVLLEYCNRPVTDDYVEYEWDRSELSWNEDKGNFKSKMAELRDSLFLFEDAIFDRDDLDLDTAVDLFVDAYHIKSSSKPAIRRYFEEKLDQLDLECPDEIRLRARALAEQAEERGVTTGVHPAGFAAACLYTAGRKKGRWLTQSEAADVANVTTTTIRNHHDVLQQFDIVQRADRATVAVQESFIKQ
jgi:hypothetical protein